MPKKKMPGGYDRELKKARERYNSKKTQTALREAIGSIPGISDEDVTRTIEDLKLYRDRFKNIEDPDQFHNEVVAWAVRQAELRANYPKLLSEPQYNHRLLFNELPNYCGEVEIESLRAWADEVRKREAEAIALVPSWYVQYRRAVYKTIWKELKTCLDLGVGGYAPINRTRVEANKKAVKTARNAAKEATESDFEFGRLYHPLVEELASEVWLWVHCMAYDLMTSPVPMYSRLTGKAARVALLWKLARLENRRIFVSQTALDESRRRIEALYSVDDKTTLSCREIRLLQRARPIDMEDVQALDNALWDPETEKMLRSDLSSNEQMQDEMSNEDDDTSLDELPLAA
jgi:hypothetical protein